MPSFLFVLEELCTSSDTEIVALFKRISDECMIARPDGAILQLLPRQEG